MNETQSVARQELERLQEYRTLYEETNPYPSKRGHVQPVIKTFRRQDYSFLRIMGVTALGYVLAAIGGITYSSIRTIGIFANQIREELLVFGWNVDVVNFLTAISALAIMGCIELFLASWGYDRGKESGKMSTSRLGFALAFLIAVGAGFIASLGLVEDSLLKEEFAKWVNWSLAFLSAIGISLLVYFGSENLGVIHTRWLNFLKSEEDSIDKWNERQRSEAREENDAIDREYEAAVAKWEKAFQEDYRKTGRAALFGEDRFVVSRKKSPSPAKTAPSNNGGGGLNGSLTDTVRKFLKDSNLRASDIGTDQSIHTYPPVWVCNELGLEGQDRRNIHTILGRLVSEEQSA